MKRFIAVFAVISALTLLSSCTTANAEVEENLSPGDFFQKAQSAAMDYGNYQQALTYYKTFIERYPDEQLLIIEAEYEIAFLYYKMEDYDTSRDLFTKILEKYKQPEAAILPAWPKVLSTKIVEIMDTSSAEAAAEAAAKEAAGEETATEEE